MTPAQSEAFLPAEKSAAHQRLSRPSLSYWQDAWIRLRKNRQAMISLWTIVGLILFTLLGPELWRIDPAVQDVSRISEGPGLGGEAVVVGPLPAFEPETVAGWPESPPAPASGGSQLPAPTMLETVGEPSISGVRLRWTPVAGAASYVIYRAEGDGGEKSLGVPIGEVDGGNKVTYEDVFNLTSKTFYYSVVPKNGDESNFFVSRRVSVPVSISIETAQKINPDAKVGQMIPLALHPLGTDYLGRDMLSRLMSGARVSLFIGFFSPLLSVLFGILIGGISGYAGGRVDSVLMRFTDFVLALPFLLFMILFKVAFGAQPGESGIVPMLVSIVILSWTSAARLVRGQLLQLRESEFVQASRLLGASPTYIILRHLLPNTLGVILVTLTFSIPSAIFTEAFLSFIGMGVAPPTASWGGMCSDGVQTFLTHPHEFFFPAILISLTVLAFNRLGDGLRDALDPRLRGQS